MLDRNLPKLNRHPSVDDERRVKRLEETNFASGIFFSIRVLNHLVSFLNRTKTKRGKNIVGIVEQLLEIDEMTRPIPPGEPIGAQYEMKRTDPRYELHREVNARHAKLQQELSTYKFTARASVYMGSGGRGPSQWDVGWIGDLAIEDGVALTSTEALELVLKLTQLGEIGRLRHCPLCHKWLFARSSHKTFCSTKCQQKSYSQRETWQEHRRLYMRRYYKKHFSKKR